MVKVGDIVTITVDNPDGLEEMHMNGVVGVLSEYYEGSDVYDPSWRIDTDDTEGFLYGREQFREATKEEKETKLRELRKKAEKALKRLDRESAIFFRRLM